MRILLLALAGCAASTTATPEPMPDFHDYTNPDGFCYDAGLGFYAIGFREGTTSWTDELFCVSDRGLHQVTATRNGAEVKVRNRYTQPSVNRIGWIGRHGIGDARVSLADGLVDGCPDAKRPIAILATRAEVASAGAYIGSGILLCVEGDDLVVRGDDGDRGELDRFEDFTPIR